MSTEPEYPLRLSEVATKLSPISNLPSTDSAIEPNYPDAYSIQWTFGINTLAFTERVNLQIRADMFNATNTRNFGIPNGTVTSANFLNQWATNGGNRRIVLGLRYTF